MVARGLDHIVHAVRDLDAAVELYRRLGFQVGARNRHPRAWGTQNHIIQLPGTFVELLSLADTSEIAPHTPRHFSFGAFNRDFVMNGQGLSMLVLKGRGASDADDFRANGIGDFELYEFEREGKRPDGAPVKVAFALAFASDPGAPDIGFFTSMQYYPENFWNPAFQVHANSAKSVAGVVLVAQDPGSHANFLSAFAGVGAGHTTPSGLTFKTPRGDIDVTTPDEFLLHYGVPAPAVSDGARLAALRFSVGDASLLKAVPEEAGIAGLYAGDATVIGREDAMGAILVFEPAR
jgi:catechol 2,3-dioxygenase-like lactoylglutathione lyase family enzyme